MEETPANAWRDPGVLARFLQNVRGAAPLTIEQVDIALRLTAAATSRLRKFLCIGSGESTLAAALLDEYPRAQGVLLDATAELIDTARHRLRAQSERMTIVRSDYATPGWEKPIAHLAPFDCVIASVDIFHVNDIRQREIFAEVLPLLERDGLFLNIEHVASATRWTESVMDDYVIDAIFGEQLKTSDGRPRAQVAREFYALATQQDASKVAPLEVQCDWLRELGYVNVDTYHKVSELAVFGGQRPGGEQ